jgi:hypothetical protein
MNLRGETYVALGLLHDRRARGSSRAAQSRQLRRLAREAPTALLGGRGGMCRRQLT